VGNISKKCCPPSCSFIRFQHVCILTAWLSYEIIKVGALRSFCKFAEAAMPQRHLKGQIQLYKFEEFYFTAIYEAIIFSFQI